MLFRNHSGRWTVSVLIIEFGSVPERLEPRIGDRTDDSEAGALPRPDCRHQRVGIDHHSHSAVRVAEPKAAFKSLHANQEFGRRVATPCLRGGGAMGTMGEQ